MHRFVSPTQENVAHLAPPTIYLACRKTALILIGRRLLPATPIGFLSPLPAGKQLIPGRSVHSCYYLLGDYYLLLAALIGFFTTCTINITLTKHKEFASKNQTSSVWEFTDYTLEGYSIWNKCVCTYVCICTTTVTLISKSTPLCY